MKKIIHIFISLLIFISCEKKSKISEIEKVTYFYPNKNLFDAAANKIFIKLDTFSSFNRLLEKIDKISCEKETPIVLFENENSIFNLIPIHMCYADMQTWCPKARNEIAITKDSIIIDYNINVSIDSFPDYIRRHIQNHGKENFLSDSPNKAFFSILKDSSLSVTKTKEILIELSEKFNEINKSNGDSLPLFVFIGSEKIEIMTPPPPPKWK